MLVFALCVSVVPSALQAQYTDEMIVARIRARDFVETMRVAQAGLDLMEERDGDDLFAWVNHSQMAELRKNGFDVRIDRTRTEELRRDSQVDTFNGGYRTVEETIAFVNQMAAQYPQLAQSFTYGQSWNKLQNPNNGYNLFGIKLTNRNTTGNKPTFFLEAGIHARELVPPEIATRFIEYLLKNYGRDADVTWLLDEHQIVVIPIVNPDGRKIAETNAGKRKNANTSNGSCSQTTFGIDLNRNFSYFWGTVNLPTESPCSETFPGLSAASEPETQGIQTLVNSLFPDQRGPLRTDPAPQDATGVFLDMHSTGNLVLYPWGQDNLPPPNIQLRTIARKMAGYNGYNPIQSIQLYPTSGTAREYAYGELGIAGLAMEIGLGSGTCGGFAPAFTCIEGGGTSGSFWQKNLPVLLYLSKIARTPYITSEGATAETLVVSRTATPGTFALRAQISDAANGNQTVAAAEVYVDTPPWRGGTPVAMTAEDGAFDSPVEFAAANVNISPGRHIFYVRGRDSANNWGAVKAAFTPRSNVAADFDGDGRTDVSVYRPTAGAWYVSQSSNAGFSATAFGAGGDIIAPGDFDGDGKTDHAVFRPSNGTWYILRSQAGFSAVQFGQNGDVPVAGDYDGDGKADIAVYRAGNWYRLNSSNGEFVAVGFGTAEDKPTVGDYDADGKADPAVFRPSNGGWYLLKSTEGFAALSFGISTDRPVQADYDGDGKTDIAVYRDGSWYILQSQAGFSSVAFGIASDAPAPGDFDGDGKADLAVFRSGAWYILQTAGGFITQPFGAAGDEPIPAGYIP